MVKRLFLCVLLITLSTFFATAQTDYQSFFEKSMKTNNTGMYVLGSWAIANMATGAYGWAKTTGQTKYFHQMNLFWNTVILSIAGFALYSNLNTDIASLTQQQMLQKHTKTENLYLINAGLDVLYVGAGFLMKHYAGKKPKRHDLLKGYGNSVILQGSFLFVFDLILYGIQRNHRIDFIDNLSLFYQPEFNAVQVALNIPLN